VVHHFALPEYRLPVFRELAATQDIDLKVVYAAAPGLSNVEAVGFEAEASKTRRLATPRAFLAWDSAQWRYSHRVRADVLIMTWNTRYISLVPALLRARYHGVKTILWGHGYSRRDSPWRRWLRRAVARFASAVVLYNHREAERFIAMTGRSESTFVALNTVDQAPIQTARAKWLADEQALRTFRRANGLTEGATILFVSRYQSENRLELLIEATALLRSKHPDISVIVIGEGNQVYSDLIDRLEMSEVFRLVGPIYNEMALAPWFLCSDMFCYPSNVGLSILHAFGYGLPVVSGDRWDRQGPEWEALTPGVNGLHAAYEDVGSLAAALDALLADAALRQRLGRGAHDTAVVDYSLDKMVAGLRQSIAYCVGA
jgi:glycosyltransferase involved in cell wall biosynthesis